MAPGYVHEAMATEQDEEIVRIACAGVARALSREPTIAYFPAWTDGGLLSAYGRIPTVILAPGDVASAHSDEEHIETDSLKKAVSLYTWIINQFCK